MESMENLVKALTIICLISDWIQKEIQPR